MSYRNRLAAAALAALSAAAPLAAQTDRSVVIGMYGGGYEHMLDLNAVGTARFMPGYSVGATVGAQLNRYVALHGDFTFHGCDVQGDASFAGKNFDLFFYGAHVELGYPLAGGVTPYLFLGGGAVTIDELGSAATISPFTKPAAMFGAGLFYSFFGTRFELFAQAKDLVYRWDRGGFAPIEGYVTTTGGQTYRVELDRGRFDRPQWDVTYTAGVSYRFKTGTRHSTPPTPPSDE
jgi:opacity protein-like surface antigen